MTARCQCNRHDPPLFALCEAKVAPGETICAWCANGHPQGLGTLQAIGRTIGKSFRLWAQRTF
jgi:hypothetical protein